jgi:hypothetical protein
LSAQPSPGREGGDPDLDEAAELLLRGDLGLGDGGDLLDRGDALVGGDEDLGVEALEAAEIVVDRGRVRARPLGDLLAGGAVVALLGEDLARRLEQLRAGAGAVPPPRDAMDLALHGRPYCVGAALSQVWI